MIAKLRDILVRLKNENPWLLFIWLENQRKKGIKSLQNLDDTAAINKLFKDYTGKLPNLMEPKTWGEKQQWLKLHYHNPIQTTCSDKYEVRKFIEEKGYGDTLNDLIAVFYDIKDFDSKILPNRFVIKASHGSGWNFVCKDKSKVNWFIWKKIMNSWLKNNIFWPGREWPYKNMKPSVIVEKYLEDESGQLMDYKFFCFDGDVRFVQANKGRGSANHAQNFYDLNWSILPFGKDLVPRPDINIPKPSKLEEMIAMAKDLSQGFPFVRVDLYETNKKIVFGELTFYPKSGLPDFTPPKYDDILGEYIVLPS